MRLFHPLLILSITSFLNANYFYSQGKKIYINPAQGISRDMNEQEGNLYETETSKEKITIYNTVLFKLKSKKDLDLIVQKYQLKDIELLAPLTYQAAISKKSSVLEVSNQMYKDPRTIYAHPDMSINTTTQELDDDTYPDSFSNPLRPFAAHLTNMQIERLWALAPKKGGGINVAIMDTEIDYFHIDLKANHIENYDTQFTKTTSTNGHGTKTIGIISALDNEVGSVGIAPNSKFYSIPMTNRSGEFVKIFNWLISKDVGVLNNSWGATFYTDSMANSLKDLKDKGRGGKGTIVTYASGNKALDLDRFSDDLAELPTVIGVGSLNELGELSYYSNYGSEIDIYTFGGESYAGLLTTTLSNRYYPNYSGTSAATPVVSGVVALMLSVNPDLGFEEIKTILQETADLTPGGYKRMNALRALQKVNQDLGLSDKPKTTTKSTNKVEASNADEETLETIQGWNLLGTSKSMSLDEIRQEWGDFMKIYVQDRSYTKNFKYNEQPETIKAGEGFWLFKE